MDPIPSRIDDEIRCVADPELLQDANRAIVVVRGIFLVDRLETFVVDFLEPQEHGHPAAVFPHLDEIGKFADDVAAGLNGVVLADAGFRERLGHLPAAFDVHPENVVGDEDVGGFDLRQLIDDALRRFFAERTFVKFPDRAEIAFEWTSPRGFQQGQRPPEADVILTRVVADQMASRERKLVEIAPCRSGSGMHRS